jgi:hypothetical protein
VLLLMCSGDGGAPDGGASTDDAEAAESNAPLRRLRKL